MFLKGFLSKQEHAYMLERMQNLSKHPRSMSEYEKKCLTRIYKDRDKRPFTVAERKVVDEIHCRKEKPLPESEEKT